MTRHFSKNQRRVLVWTSGGYCSICCAKLDHSFHADHVQPFSKGGATVIKNGQALCMSCNLRKGSK